MLLRNPGVTTRFLLQYCTFYLHHNCFLLLSDFALSWHRKVQENSCQCFPFYVWRQRPWTWNSGWAWGSDYLLMPWMPYSRVGQRFFDWYTPTKSTSVCCGLFLDCLVLWYFHWYAPLASISLVIRVNFKSQTQSFSSQLKMTKRQWSWCFLRYLSIRVIFWIMRLVI